MQKIPILFIIHYIVYNDPSSFIILLERVFFNIFQRKFVLPFAAFRNFHPVQHVKEHLPQPRRLVGLRLCKVRRRAGQRPVAEQLLDPVHDPLKQFCNPLQDCLFLPSAVGCRLMIDACPLPPGACSNNSIKKAAFLLWNSSNSLVDFWGPPL